MTIYKDVNGREFTYNEYWSKIYLDEKRPHVDHLIRHKYPEEKPVVPDEVEFKVYLARYKIDEFIFIDSVAYYKDTGWGTSGVTHWWELPEVGKED